LRFDPTNEMIQRLEIALKIILNVRSNKYRFVSNTTEINAL